MKKTITILGTPHSLAERIENYVKTKKTLKWHEKEVEFIIKTSTSIFDDRFKGDIPKLHKYLYKEKNVFADIIIDFGSPQEVLANLSFITYINRVDWYPEPRAVICASRMQDKQLDRFIKACDREETRGVLLTDQETEALMKADYLIDFLLIKSLTAPSGCAVNLYELMDPEFDDE